jgi:hypothetical protein
MKYRPDDAELLAAIAGLLEDEVMGAVPPALAHKVRVAANLARILERQEELEPGALRRERDRLAALLGRDGVEVTQLRAELDRRLRGGDAALDQLDESDVWEVLVATARDDLSVAKPGYDFWSGE